MLVLYLLKIFSLGDPDQNVNVERGTHVLLITAIVKKKNIASRSHTNCRLMGR